jgi:cysteine desulfurase
VRHYLDHAATTPVRPAALEAMTEQLARTGNASSLHTSGRLARRVVEESRESIAQAIGCRPSEVVFTSGGTESDNLAVQGTSTARRDADPRRTRLLVSTVEHHAVLDAVDFLAAHEGAKVTWLEADALGRVTPDTVRRALAEDPASAAVVSVMWANNEVGTVQDIAGIVSAAKEFGVPAHTDAVQAVGHLPVDIAAVDVDLASLTAHKLGGPVGVGALVVKREHRLVPLSHGGGQERQVRSGTLDVAGIRAFAVAVSEAVSSLEAESARLVDLRDRLVEGALGLGLDIAVGGAWTPGSTADRLPGNVHLVVPGCDGDSLLYLLDAAGIECSTGSACQAGVPQPSHVLLAMGLGEEQARGALRLTLGWTSTPADVEAVLAALPPAVERARRASGRSR